MVANKIKKIAVFGPGMMGHAIAQEFAQAGYGVTLCGRSGERLHRRPFKKSSAISGNWYTGALCRKVM